MRSRGWASCRECNTSMEDVMEWQCSFYSYVTITCLPHSDSLRLYTPEDQQKSQERSKILKINVTSILP